LPEDVPVAFCAAHSCVRIGKPGPTLRHFLNQNSCNGKRPPAKQVTLNLIMHSTTIQYRFFRLVYDSPQRPQIDAAVKVCIDLEAAIGLLHGLNQLFSLLTARAPLYFQDQFHRLLSFQQITWIPGSTGYHAGGPSAAAMTAPPGATYLCSEKYFGRFFGLLSHQTPVRDRT
jgi:hypothetical protein